MPIYFVLLFMNPFGAFRVIMHNGGIPHVLPAALGSKAMTALRQIQEVLGLDYGGIDFGLNRKGEMLLFEANATMVIPPPDADQRWDYRRAAVERISKAVEKMLMDRAEAKPSELPMDAQLPAR